jgi:predicted RNA polymerase sigma factor
MRLSALLLEHPLGAAPVTYALTALMCLDAARLPARVDASGNLISLIDQDRSQWDQELIAEGQRLLALSAAGLRAHPISPGGRNRSGSRQRSFKDKYY